MEHKAVKKAKKGLFSIVFGRTALILMLVLIQLIILVGVATILNDYAVYVYGGFTVLAAVIVIYIINERGNPAFNMTWVLLILIFSGIWMPFLYLGKVSAWNKIYRKAIVYAPA